MTRSEQQPSDPPTPLTDEQWLTPTEVAEIFAVSKMTVYRLCEADELRWIRVGRSIRIRSSSVQRFVTQGGSAVNWEFSAQTPLRLVTR